MTFQNAKIVAKGVSYAEYAQQDAERGETNFVMSRGELMDFAACPHKWLSGYRSPDTKATDWGALIDCLLLSPDQFDALFAVCPGKYTNEKGEKKDWNFNATVCKEWKSEHYGKRIIKAVVKKDAEKAVDALLQHDAVHQLVSCSEKQVMVTAEYHDRATGLVIPVKTLIDMAPDQLNVRFGKKLADLKTGQSANPREFETAIFYNDYDAQAAMYLDVYTAATNEERIEWLFVLQESGEPYEVADPLPMLSHEYLELGRAKYVHALKFYAHCLAHDTWPGYSPGHRMVLGDTYLVEPKPWMPAAVMDLQLNPQPDSEEAL